MEESETQKAEQAEVPSPVFKTQAGTVVIGAGLAGLAARAGLAVLESQNLSREWRERLSVEELHEMLVSHLFNNRGDFSDSNLSASPPSYPPPSSSSSSVVMLEARERIGGRVWSRTLPSMEWKLPLNGSKGLLEEALVKLEGCVLDIGAAWVHGLEGNPLVDLLRCDKEEHVQQDVGNREEEVACEEAAPDHVVETDAGSCPRPLYIGTPDNLARQPNTATQPLSLYSVGNGKLDSHTTSTVYDTFVSATSLLREAVFQDRFSGIDAETVLKAVLQEHSTSLFPSSSDSTCSIQLLPRAVEWCFRLVENWIGADFSEQSAEDRFGWGPEAYGDFPGPHFHSKKGLVILCEVLQRAGKGPIELGCPVTEIRMKEIAGVEEVKESEKEAKVLVRFSSSSSEHDEDMEIECNRVVCTIPLSILSLSFCGGTRSVHVDPETNKGEESTPSVCFGDDFKSAEKEEAMSKLKQCHYMKIFLLFRSEDIERHKENDEDEAEGASRFIGLVDAPDECGTLTLFEKFEFEGTGYVAVLAVGYGSFGAKLHQMPHTQVCEMALSSLRLALPNTPDPIAYCLTGWDTDPFSQGAYTFDPLGTTCEDIEALAAPSGKGGCLLFGGEHTDPEYLGSTHGAYLSGLRCAIEAWFSEK